MPYIYNYLNFYVLALDIPPNIYTALRPDLALIEYPAFDHVRHLRGDGRGLAYAWPARISCEGLGMFD